ncbi:hypothetical protein, partial [Citrobacter braakii]|uniref:hypothetical protein n=1 Tax=Citrobacter braakii TaxID=57706 RepID=UPI003D6DD55E
IPDSVSISFRGVLEITESTGVPDASTPLLRLENEMAPITVDSLSLARGFYPINLQVDQSILCINSTLSTSSVKHYLPEENGS